MSSMYVASTGRLRARVCKTRYARRGPKTSSEKPEASPAARGAPRRLKGSLELSLKVEELSRHPHAARLQALGRGCPRVPSHRSFRCPARGRLRYGGRLRRRPVPAPRELPRVARRGGVGTRARTVSRVQKRQEVWLGPRLILRIGAAGGLARPRELARRPRR